MNDPSTQPIDIAEQREWLIEHSKATGVKIAPLAKRVGIPYGTLSQFVSTKGYAGDERKLAEKIYRYRQTLASQQVLRMEAPEIPGYFRTDTSTELEGLLKIAQRGRIVVAAMGPGTGKTMTAKQFCAAYSNVHMATMRPSSAGVNNMQIAVLKSLGERDAKGTPQKLSQMICDRVRDLTNPLLIIDEAQHLSEKAIEEIRSWHDETDVGIALLGNIGVMQRLEGGNRAAAYAQLYSRIGQRLVRNVPLKSDALALAEAWNIHGEDEQAFICKVALLPGGLRGATMMLEWASMIAHANHAEALTEDHLQDAWANLSSRAVSA